MLSEDIVLDLLFSNLNMINMDVEPSVVCLAETDKSGYVMKKNVVTQAKLENNSHGCPTMTVAYKQNKCK